MLQCYNASIYNKLTQMLTAKYAKLRGLNGIVGYIIIWCARVGDIYTVNACFVTKIENCEFRFVFFVLCFLLYLFVIEAIFLIFFVTSVLIIWNWELAFFRISFWLIISFSPNDDRYFIISYRRRNSYQ